MSHDSPAEAGYCAGLAGVGLEFRWVLGAFLF